MSALSPGLYKATVRGVTDVTVFVDSARLGRTADYVMDHREHIDEDITDARPLIVLDLTDYLAHTLALDLRQGRWGDIADQIIEQLKPARIEEPGLWGVVACTDRHGFHSEWVRRPDVWQSRGGNVADWADLEDPKIIRDGVPS